MIDALVFLLAAAAQTPAALLDEAASRLSPAQLEDDLGGADSDIERVTTAACQTVVRAGGKDYRIDWTKEPRTALGDTFVFVEAPGVKFAIVGDASRPDQADELRVLAGAMTILTIQCRPLNVRVVPLLKDN